MRASSLSNEKVIDLVNKYFVPVYTSNEDFAEGGEAPADERRALQRIYRATLTAGLSAGTVHVYVVAADGTPIDSRHVADACKVDNLTDMLQKSIDRLGLVPGKTLAAPRPQSRPPAATAGDLVLHLVARNVTRDSAIEQPTRTRLGESSSVNWGSYPAENWIVLGAADQQRLVPNRQLEPGDTWDLDNTTVEKILTYVYPSTENNDVTKNRFQQVALTARVLDVRDGVARTRIDGRMKMEHWFYHKPDGKYVDAPLVGLMEIGPGRTIRDLRWTTDGATYGGGEHRYAFGVVIESDANLD